MKITMLEHPRNMPERGISTLSYENSTLSLSLKEEKGGL